LFDEPVHAFPALADIEREGLKDGHEVFFDGEFTEDGGFLGEVADASPGALVHREVGDFFFVELDDAGIGTDEADDHVEAGGFAGSVGAEETDDFTLLDGDGDVIDDLAATIALGDFPGF